MTYIAPLVLADDCVSHSTIMVHIWISGDARHHVNGMQAMRNRGGV